MALRTGTPPHHNALTCYTDYRCRLPECVARFNDHSAARARAQRAGTWNGLVDAEPVRQHLLRLLAAGITPHQIAAAAGITPHSITDFTRPGRIKSRGRRQRVTPDVAARILSTTPDNITPTCTEAIGTVRRVQALVTIGWPQNYICAHAGLSELRIPHVQRRGIVRTTTAVAIARTYDELRSRRPERCGVDKSEAQKARRRGAANHWPTPAYWDDYADCIDDPDFHPLYGIPRLQTVAEDAAWLLAAGHSEEHVTARLGISRSYMQKAIAAMRQRQAAA